MEEEKKVQAKPKGRFASKVVMATSALTAITSTALAADPPAGGLDTVVGAMSTTGELMSSVLTMITGNPILVVFFTVPLIGVGVAVFRMIKGAAKH